MQPTMRTEETWISKRSEDATWRGHRDSDEDKKKKKEKRRYAMCWVPPSMPAHPNAPRKVERTKTREIGKRPLLASGMCVVAECMYEHVAAPSPARRRAICSPNPPNSPT